MSRQWPAASSRPRLVVLDGHRLLKGAVGAVAFPAAGVLLAFSIVRIFDSNDEGIAAALGVYGLILTVVFGMSTGSFWSVRGDRTRGPWQAVVGILLNSLS